MELLTDEYFMKLAMQEAEKALAVDEIPVGAVVVIGNRVVAKAHNLTERLQDVTAHAEMQAITSATNYLGAKYLKNATLYVTVEPCAMCAGAMAWSQISRLVFGASEPRYGYSRYKPSLLHPKTEVKTGVLHKECAGLMQLFFRNKR